MSTNEDKQYHAAIVKVSELEKEQRRGWETQPIGDVDLGDDVDLTVIRRVRRNDGAVLFGLTLTGGPTATELWLDTDEATELLELLHDAIFNELTPHRVGA